jgi:TonB-dependent starch-binding outer membrane protein SusC
MKKKFKRTKCRKQGIFFCLSLLLCLLSIEGSFAMHSYSSSAISKSPGAQQTIITGSVKDNKGEPMIGVSISVKGTTNGAITDENGNFSITLPNDDAVLVFSFIGYTKQEVSTKGKTILNIILEDDISKQLDEIIVVGYSTSSKMKMSGAVGTISSNDIKQTPSSDLTGALQGRIAGVEVSSQGGPGASQIIRIRGIGSIGSNDPLYVIDGVQTTSGLNMINQNDIETITVLKDASTSAIYGARGSNGVIVITTKQGKKGTPKLEYNTYVSLEQAINLPKMISPQEQADAYWEGLKNGGMSLSDPIYGSGTSPILPDYVISSTTGTSPLTAMEGDAIADASLYNYETYRIFKTNKLGTNWAKEVFKNSLSQSHQLGISGGGENANYAISLNYLDQNGTLLETYFKRYSIRANTNFTIKPWLKIGEDLLFSYSKDYGITSENYSTSNVIADLYSASTLMPVYDIAGNYAGNNLNDLGECNPVADMKRGKENKDSYTARVFGSAYLDFEPLKNLVFESRIGIDYMPTGSSNFVGVYPEQKYSSSVNSFSEGTSKTTEWRWTNKISYNFNIANNHFFSAFIGYEASEYKYRYSYATVYDLYTDVSSYWYLGDGNANETPIVGGSGDKSRLISQFGSFNYSYKNRYLLTASIRRDGSSKFGSNSRYGIFPSVSAGWIVTNESFMENQKWLDNFKLRASWGKVGNDAIASGLTVNQYKSDATYSYYDITGSNNSSVEGLNFSQLGNSYLKWEENHTLNLGFDATLLKNISIGFSWFDRKTKNLLYAPPTTAMQGDAGSPTQNVMSFDNKGVEIELGYKGSINKDLSYSMNFNFSTYRNNVTYIDGNENTFINGGYYQASSNWYLTRTVVDRPVGSFYGYKCEGIYQNLEEVEASGIYYSDPSAMIGHFKFANINADTVINDEDRTFLGDPTPKFTYGYNLNVNYKNFDFNLFLQGVYGGKIFNYWRSLSVFGGQQGAGSTDTWSETNTDASLPKYVVGGDFLDNRPSSFFIEDASYLRLKSIQLGYSITAIKGIERLRLYIQGTNLLTWTKYSGLDPEVNNGDATSRGIDYGGFYPVSRGYLVGLNVNF